MNNFDIENSALERQNVLNNPFVIIKLQNKLDFKGFQFEGEIKWTREQVRLFYDIDDKTIERHLSSFENELRNNGYEVIKGKKLKEVKALTKETDINVGLSANSLGIFNLRAFLNLGMLLQGSAKAAQLRSIILDVVISTLNERLGGTVQERKYVNQKDPYYLDDRFLGKGYRKELTDALKSYVADFKTDGGKYAVTTNKIYARLFLEKAKEYRDILELAKKDQTRDTMYSDVLNSISIMETGLADKIRRKFSEKNGQWLSHNELVEVIDVYFSDPAFEPMALRVRRVMASRDHILRGIDHEFLSSYIAPLEVEDYNRFLHDISAKELRHQKQIEIKKLPKLFKEDVPPVSKLDDEDIDDLLKGAKN